MSKTDKINEFLSSYTADPAKYEGLSAEEILNVAIKNFSPKIAFASSFGAEDVVIIDMLHKIHGDNARVFTLDTGRLNPETYDVMDRIRKKYSINIETMFPDFTEVQKMVTEKGVNLMYNSVEERKLCCEIRKVHPLRRMLKDLDAWITGLRRDQTFTRSNVKKLELDVSNNNIIKVNPLVEWSNDMVWEYIKNNDIPYNSLHDKGYPSIGCAPCTRAIGPGEDLRAGRWWWENDFHKECGLHWNK
jgi:phosphoadenosine phosphosulfate reductase